MMPIAPAPETAQPSHAGARTIPFPRPRRPLHKRTWFRCLVAVIAIALVFDYGVSAVLASGWLHHKLTQRLSMAFGRPVEVSNYSFSLLEGPRLDANYITVAEDPRFGNEYFLRADQLAASLRWRALLRGRIELGTLSFTRPHLNLVELPNGDWNLESWLPWPGATPVGARSVRAFVPLHKIEVSDGRLDFKQGATKLPFALVNVAGSVERVAPGSWDIDLKAQPFRAAVVLQNAGTLRLRGRLGGTSSRLRPAALQLNWNAASFSDLLRLFRGADYGVRGLFSLQLQARTVSSGWLLSARSQFRNLHRWDLALRPDDPAANLHLEAQWNPAQSRFDLTRAVVELPRSRIEAAGAAAWNNSNPDHFVMDKMQGTISSASLDLSDVLSWYRAFHANVPEPLALHGVIRGTADFSGWPPRLQRSNLSAEGVELDGGSAPVPIRIARVSAMVSKDNISIPPFILAIGANSGDFVVRGSASRTSHRSALDLDGKTANVRSIFSAAGALGYGLPAGWIIEGPAQIHLKWQGAPWPKLRDASGTLALNGWTVHAPFFNRDMKDVRGSVKMIPGDSKIQIASASLFGTNWRGQMERDAASDGWTFSLSAENLSASGMDQWLNPQRRPNFLERLLPFLSSQPRSEPLPHWLRGHGNISVGEFTLSSFPLRNFRADAVMDGRRLEFTHATAGFSGGTLEGSIALDLTAKPSYAVAAKFNAVNLGQLTGNTFSLADLFAGKVSGALEISAQGLQRQELLASLSCSGTARVWDAEYAGLDLLESLRAGARHPGVTEIPRGSAEFSCANGQVNFSDLSFSGFRSDAQQIISGSGYVDFERQMHLRLHSDADGDFLLSGALKNPLLTTGPLRAASH